MSGFHGQAVCQQQDDQAEYGHNAADDLRRVLGHKIPQADAAGLDGIFQHQVVHLFHGGVLDALVQNGEQTGIGMAGNADAQLAGVSAQRRRVQCGVTRFGPQVVDDMGIGVGGVGLAFQQGIETFFHGIVIQNFFAGILLGDALGKPVALLQGNDFDLSSLPRADQKGRAAQIFAGGIEVVMFIPEVASGHDTDHINLALGGHFQPLQLGQRYKVKEQAALALDMLEKVRHYAGKAARRGIRIFQRRPAGIIRGFDNLFLGDERLFRLGKTGLCSVLTEKYLACRRMA